MTDVQWLFLVLVLFYCWECACWIRRGSVLFRSWLGRRWTMRPPSRLWGNYRGGFVLAPPLPPLGTVIEAGTGSSFDLSRARERLAAFRQQHRPVRWLANLLFVYLLLGAPVIIYSLGLRLSWLPLLAGMFVITITTAVFFRRAHRQLHGEAAADARFSATLTIALSPANAIRACDPLSRKLFAEFHPLCLSRLLCGDLVFQRLAARWVARARFPTPAEGPLGNAAALESFVQAQGLKLPELLAPPAQREPGCRAYCPRCRAWFVAEAGSCADCGVPLQLASPDLTPSSPGLRGK